ncbi:hypothetical protein ASF20_14020 [Methylobacterium sp. Leaf88]|nr:hypothetical protein ASF20_14020 [Methylobacterium sp. Leaf88]
MADLLTLHEAAARIPMSPKTLRGYMATGAVKHIAFGHGLKRKRRMFHPDDIQAFIDGLRRSESCPPIDRKTKRARTPLLSTSTTSGLKVVGFMARRAAALSEKRTAKSKSNG